MATNMLEEKYDLVEGSVQLTGVQALLRLMVDRQRVDTLSGLRMGTFVSGYPGSPLGGFDTLLAREGRVCRQFDIVFTPGVNEELAATAVMGSQLSSTFPGFRYDGVWGLWFGKTPGVDRALDAFKHAAYVGTGRNSGVLAVAADDPGCKSSTIPNQAEQTFIAANIPVFYPGNVQEVVDLGMAALSLSRFTGAWAGMKLVTDVADGGATVDVGPHRHRFVAPEEGPATNAGTPRRCFPPESHAQEPVVVRHRLEAAKAFARANGIDRVVGERPGDTLGIVSAGKPYFDLVSALDKLGVTTETLEASGVRLLKLGMTWPIDEVIVRRFARGLSRVVVVEEKKPIIEDQLRVILYGGADQPEIYGKSGPDDTTLFPVTGELSVDAVRRALATLPGAPWSGSDFSDGTALARAPVLDVKREAWFCSGCPHNRSTKAPEGAVVGGGIGCHTLSMNMGRNVEFISQMGGEGAAWVGISPFVDTEHVFQHVGDGTFFHSGSLGVRAAVAAGVNITFKILYNGAVAMTGGQSATGGMTVPALCRALEAEGVRRIEVVSDDPSRYANMRLAEGVSVSGRDDLDQVQEALRGVRGVTALVYDQQCALEKRRARKRAPSPVPAPRVYVSQEICDACGDCATKSNCISLGWSDTWLGPKVEVQQSTCNLDYTCVDGECPSFFTVVKGTTSSERREPPRVAEPRARPTLDRPYRIVMGGIGGKGVVTANAILAQACQIEGKFDVHLDQTGMAQKGGSVVSHLVISDRPLSTPARTGFGDADLLLGFDVLTVFGRDLPAMSDPTRTVAILSTTVTPAARQIGRPHVRPPSASESASALREVVRHLVTLDAEALAEDLVGEPSTSNVFMLGVAFQRGLLPLNAVSIEQAIEANGVNVPQNLNAFRWGRAFADDTTIGMREVRRDLPSDLEESTCSSATSELVVAGYDAPFAAWVALRAARLALYQSPSLARMYIAIVRERVPVSVARRVPEVARSVAHQLFRLRYIKDEYEVARLALSVPREVRSDPAFAATSVSVQATIAPPFLTWLGVRRKITVPESFFVIFRMVAAMRVLRGGVFDIFRFGRHRREERRLVAWFDDVSRRLVESDLSERATAVLGVLEIVDGIRGYGETRARKTGRAVEEVERLLRALEGDPPSDESASERRRLTVIQAKEELTCAS